MSVYIDDYNAQFRGMTMCHMIADTMDELYAMADRIGLKRQYCHDGTHFDVCLSRKKLALQYGAIEVTTQQLGKILLLKKKLYQEKKKNETPGA